MSLHTSLRSSPVQRSRSATVLAAAAASVVVSQSLAADLTVPAGPTTINQAPVVAPSTNITVYDSIIRSSGGTLLLSGAGLGDSDQNAIDITVAPTLSNGILPYAVLNRSGVLDLVTVTGATNRLTAYTGYQTGAETTWTAATVNARPNASQTVSAARTLNSLVLDSGISLNGPAADRTITLGANGVGMVLQTGGTSSLALNGTNEYILAFGANEAVFHTQGTLNLLRNGTNTITGTNGITKTGAGTLSLGTSASQGYAMSMTGNFSINDGLVAHYGNNHTSAFGTTTLVFNGGDLTIGDTAARSYGRNTVINADATFTADRSTAGAGTVYTLGTLAIGGSKLTLTNGTLFNAGTANAGFTFGATTLSGNATFEVLPVASAGWTGPTVLTLGALGDGGVGRTLSKTGDGVLSLGTTATSLVAATEFNVSAGRLQSTAANTLGSATVNVTGTGELRGTATTSFGSANIDLEGGTVRTFGSTALNVGGNLTYTSGTLVVDRSGSGATQTHTMGSLSLGAVTFTPAQANFTAAPTLVFGSSTFSGAATVDTTSVIVNLGTLSLGAPTITKQGANLLTAGATTLSANTTFDVLAGTFNVGAINDGAVARTLTKDGPGTLTLTADATSVSAGTQVNVDEGALQLGAVNAIGAASASDVTVAAGASLRRTGGTGLTTISDLSLGNGSSLSTKDGAQIGGSRGFAVTSSLTEGTGVTYVLASQTGDNSDGWAGQGLHVLTGGTKTLAGTFDVSASSNSFGVIAAGNATTLNLAGTMSVGPSGSGGLALAAYGGSTINVTSSAVIDLILSGTNSRPFRTRGDGTGTVELAVGFDANPEITDVRMNSFRLGEVLFVTNETQNYDGAFMLFAQVPSGSGTSNTWRTQTNDQIMNGSITVVAAAQRGTFETVTSLTTTNNITLEANTRMIKAGSAAMSLTSVTDPITGARTGRVIGSAGSTLEVQAGTLNVNANARTATSIDVGPDTIANTIDDTYSYTDLNNVVGKFSVASGATLNVNSRLQVLANGSNTSVVNGTLNIANGAYLDLSDNDLVIRPGAGNGTAAYTATVAKVVSGLSGGVNGFWDGPGINSSSAAADPQQRTALGVVSNDDGFGSPIFTEFSGVSGLTADDVLVKYTYFGDANLDGVINGDDYSLIDAGFGANATGWLNGDFNYDGIINGDDYSLIDFVYGSQGGPLFAEKFADHSAMFGQPYLDQYALYASGQGFAAIPEPASLGLLGLGAMLLGRRRR